MTNNSPADPGAIIAQPAPDGLGQGLTTRSRTATEFALSPTSACAAMTHAFSDQLYAGTDLAAAYDLVNDAAEAVNRGDLSDLVAMLTAQTIMLNATCAALLRLAVPGIEARIHAAEPYLRLALKAQAQCRATIETLAEIKNPRHVAFVNQANIAQGPQQVNNGVAPSRNPTNELLGAT